MKPTTLEQLEGLAPYGMFSSDPVGNGPVVYESMFYLGARPDRRGVLHG